MKINAQCPNCKEVYSVDASKIPSEGAKAKCKKCQTTFFISQDRKGGEFMENRINEGSKTEEYNLVWVYKTEYQKALNSIDDAVKLIENGKNMRGLIMLAENTGKITEIRDSLGNFYNIIFNSQDLLSQSNPQCFDDLGLELLPTSQLLSECSPEYSEEQYGTEVAEKVILDSLKEAGFKRDHWLIKPIILSEIEYMLHVLDKIVEPDFMPLEETLTNEERPDEETSRHIPRSVKLAVWRRDKGKCVECGSKEKLEHDHIIPVSKGGSNTERNIQLLCENCNRKKAAAIAG